MKHTKHRSLLHVFLTEGAIILAIVGIVLIGGYILNTVLNSKKLDVAAGIVHYRTHKGTATIDASRDLHHDLGWSDRSETGTDTGVSVSSLDSNGKNVTIDFKNHVLSGEATIVVEAGSQYSRSEIATELARRIGLIIDIEPLPTVSQ
jgi:hypothetical protein